MTKQEKNILKQFEKDLERAMADYLADKSNILTDGKQNCYEVQNVVEGSLFLSKDNQHNLNMLLAYLDVPTNFPPALEGLVTFNIKESSEACFQERTYFFLIPTGKYSANKQETFIEGDIFTYKITIEDIDYFFEQKYRLY